MATKKRATKKRPAAKSSKKSAKKQARSTTARSSLRKDAISKDVAPPKPALLTVGTPAEGASFTLKGPRASEQQPSLLQTTGTSPLAGVVDLKVKHEFRPAERGIAEDLAKQVAADDVIELEFSDGTCTWMRADEYRERFATGASRDVAQPELYVPATVSIPLAGPATRGVTSLVLKAVRVLGIDLHETSALLIANKVEKRKSLKRPGLGLYKCGFSNGFGLMPSDLTSANAGKPILVFLHGTLSSTWGSFGELWSQERSAELQQIRLTYGERVYGFEHETLAKSPLDNAIELVKALPKGTTVHLVSHSRGGLVGELLCRGCRRVEGVRTASGKKAGANGSSADGWVPTQAFTDDELALFDSKERAAQKKLLETLGELLDSKDIRVERFVRVACPALGTTLASGRLDRWLSIVGTVASKALPKSPISDVFEGLGEFVAAVLKERTDPAVLPGIEAMMPESPFIRMINWPQAVVDGELVVIAGDLDPDALWARLLSWISDRFYGGNHDLVVNTASMYGGANRTGTKLAGFFSGSAVNHFNYFRNADSSVVLVGALTTGKHPALKDFEPEVVDIARSIATRDGTPRPSVIFLPGIMGSELSVDGDGIWMDISDLAFGGFAKLAMGAKNVRPVEPFARFYGDLLRFLAATHRVIPFPYDWRLDPSIEAQRLSDLIEKELDAAEKSGQPVRIMAHSMGGLVTRAMIANHPRTWRRMCMHPGARFVMLGTPNGGSHSIPELVLGRSGTLKQLALLDLKNSAAELLDVILPMPGVLAMLPHDPRDDYFDTATWAAFKPHLDDDWKQPALSDLAAARKFRQLIDDSPLDGDRVLYVAGRAPQTISGIRIDTQQKKKDKRLVLEATNRGDGRVTWDSGIPTGIRTWYMDAIHGDLCSTEKCFDAIADLLMTGTTTRLPTTQPVQRGAGEVISTIEPTEPLYPDEVTLSAQLLGASPRRRVATKTLGAQVGVRVVHGDLAYASYPVMVGHYSGDTIISAEKALDKSLRGQLSQRLQLGLYPGPLSTNAIFVNPQLRKNGRTVPKGAIVVGLGMPGLLASSQLVQTLTRGLIEYVATWTSQGLPSNGSGASRELGVSALLIGSGMGGVETADSVAACLRAVLLANETLATAGHGARIATIEFIEVWQDRAYEAIVAFNKVEAEEPTLAGRLVFDRKLYRANGHRERQYFFEESGWWHRIHISGVDAGNLHRKGLQFSATTRKAQGSQQLLSVQRDQVDEFIEQAISSNEYDRATSRTLFELLLPNSFKDGSLAEDNLVLLVDEESAQYPWELLEDPLSSAGSQSEPFICRHGLLRQLASENGGATGQPSISNDVLIVGDPLSKFVELQGAQEEARVAAKTFEALGRYRVTLLERPRGKDVLASLFDRPYRVLHLAGHGVVNYQPNGSDPITGMVIGDGVYLTPHEIEQLRPIPELVFINCCHLGHINGDAARANQHRGYNRIAANLAQAFIQKGVRAVVAAGWAVGDAAASAFARQFYQQMLSGARFGDATLRARRYIYNQFPRDNTWGAYQCYGDPDYRLVMAAGSGASAWSFDSEEEEIADIELRLQTADDATTGQFLKRLDELAVTLKKKGQVGGSVALRLARAYWQGLNFENAVEFYRKALQADSQRCTLQDIEQFANLLARNAVDVVGRVSGADGKRKAEACLEEATKLLAWLTSSWEGTGSKTMERENLSASIYKRRAMIAEKKEAIRAAVAKMHEGYSQALALGKVEQGGAEELFYPTLNAIVAEMTLQWLGASDKMNGKLAARVAEAATMISGLNPTIPDFWLDIARIDCELLRTLANDAFAESVAEDFGTQYRELRVRSSRRDFGSVCDQIAFLKRMAEKSGQAGVAKGLTRTLDTMREA